jgi:hypothetical protein
MGPMSFWWWVIWLLVTLLELLLHMEGAGELTPTYHF